MEKMTNSKALEFVLNMELPTDVKEKLTNIKASIDKKNSADRKPTATQKENEVLKLAILNAMVVGTKYTVSDLMKVVPELAELSNQRVSALVRQLKESNKVDRVEIKRKAYFSKLSD